MMKNKINDGHYLELMDRLHNQAYMLETFICNHPLTLKKRRLRNLVNDACMLLSEAYQVVGEMDYKRQKKKKPIEKVIFRRRKNPKH